MNIQNLPTGISKDGELMEKPIDYTRLRYCYGETMWNVYDFLSPLEQLDLQRRLRSHHYGNLTLIDEKIGEVLVSLGNRGLLENTYIIFSSDHGASLFDNGLLHKGTHFDESVRVPFIIHHPKIVKPAIIDHFTSHVDLYPTLLTLAGGSIPNSVEGFDLSHIIFGKQSDYQEFAIMECALATSIITHSWKMSTHHINGDSDLYDIVKDPHCLNNLFNQSGYENIIQELNEQIVSWRSILNPEMDIPQDLTKWRECLGPEKYIQSFKERYIKEYEILAELDTNDRPGKVGHYVKDLLNRIID